MPKWAYKHLPFLDSLAFAVQFLWPSWKGAIITSEGSFYGNILCE